MKLKKNLVPRKLIVVCFFCTVTGSVFSEEASSRIIDKTIFGGSFSWYPTFKFGSAKPDENFTDVSAVKDYRFSVQAGLKLWKDFKFLTNLTFGGTEIEDNPVGFISKLGSSLGYKRALLNFSMHNISGSMVWKNNDSYFPQFTGPLGKRTNFSIRMTTLELMFDLTHFIKSIDDLDWAGVYLGLLYLTYDGVGKASTGGYPSVYDGNLSYKGGGISVGVDTLTRYLLDDTKIDIHIAKNIYFVPWFKFETAITLGKRESSAETVKLIMDNPHFSAQSKEDFSKTGFAGIYRISGVLGGALDCKIGFTNVVFGLGYDFLFILIDPLLHNEGLIFNVTFSF